MSNPFFNLSGNVLYDWFGKNIGVQVEDFGMKLLIGIAILAAGFLVSGQILRLVRKVMRKRGVDDTLRPFVISLLKYLLYGVTVIMAVSTMGVEMTSIIAILGSIGLAIGLSLQGALANFAGGIIIMALKPFKKGDLIEAQGHLGIVREVSVISTTLLTLDNKTIFLPNGPLAGGSITNYTKEEMRRVDMTFGIGYGDDIEKARKIILEIANSDPHVTQTPEPPFVRVVELGDSSVNFTTRLWTQTAHYWDVYFRTHEEVKKQFDAQGVSIPFPQMDVHLDKPNN